MAAAQPAIPAFEPNVVDQGAYLSAEEEGSINRLIQDMRAQADVWAAVYVVQELQDESIESLAERAFRAWKLGDQGRDNGLLLVLAMSDRKMRIETGYGLEGDLPDVVAREALDEHLRPFLRENRIKDGVLDAFVFLARRRNPQFAPSEVLSLAPVGTQPASSAPIDFKAGLVAWGLYVLWVLRGAVRHWRAPQRRNLGLRVFFIINPGIFIFVFVGLFFANLDKIRAYFLARSGQCEAVGILALGALVLPMAWRWWLNRRIERLREQSPEIGQRLQPAKVDWPSALVLAFICEALGAVGIFAGRLSKDVALQIMAGLAALISWFVYAASRKYLTPEAYRAYETLRRERERRREEALIQKGLARRTADGKLQYTPKYYASSRSAGGSSSGSSGGSSSSSSSSSSSGGGSSGGGGSSSSW